MPRVGRDDEDHPRRETMRNAFDDELELAGEHADDLLVRMLMLGKRGAGIDIYPRVRHAIGMNETGPEAWKDFADR
jgi:hypothetical protein